MSLFGFQLCIASIMLTAGVIQPFPIRRVVSRASSSPATADGADSAVKISKKTVEYLTSTSPSSFTSLYHLWSEASYLAREDVLKTKYQRWEQKVCRGRVFNVKAAEDSCKDPNGKDITLTYSQLTNYYNELVIQLKLAEHNLNFTIDLEVKEEHMNNILESEKKIIKLLNESILPVLEATLNISASNTNCSATETLFNQMVSLYTNCTAVQTSNTFLAQTSDSLYHILDKINPKQFCIVRTDDEIINKLNKPDSRKKWCIL